MKKRVDEILVEQELASDLKAASAMVMAGVVSANDQVMTKPGTKINADTRLQVKDHSRYVSRGGDKLASVIEALKLNFTNKTVLDVGSSTGGFSDLALQHGAKRVFCIDVGHGQLTYSLRQDPRIVAMERTDIRQVEQLVDPVTNDSVTADLAVVDVSFISLTKVLDSVASLIKPEGLIIAMMKPQFEADKTIADKYKGLILDEAVRRQVIAKFRREISDSFNILGEADSSLAGSRGNRERFFALKPKR